MSIYVFTGPTLSAHEAHEILDAVYLPPVSQGDVDLIARKKPQAIGIIDGYFHHVPAVWHKEILWALSQGIRVFGSASMGALRAAELGPFGMEGVGWIFEEFRSGRLEDDDEVALLHSSVQVKGVYLTASEPMVNIRRTLERAVSESVVDKATAQKLVTISKALFYGDRTYDRILKEAAAHNGNRSALERLANWLPGNCVDQKRADAVQMLQVMRNCLSTAAPAPKLKFTFQKTELWHRLRNRVRLDRSAEPASNNNIPSALRRSKEALEARREAMLRWCLLELAHRQHLETDPTNLHDTIIEFRKRRGLTKPTDLERWLEDNDLTMPEFVRLMDDESKTKRLERWIELESERVLLDVLRLDGRYQLARRDS